MTRFTQIAAITALTLGACSTSKSKDRPAGAASTAQPAPVAPASVVPAPPDGVILPAIGRARSVVAGDRTTSYTWKAVYEASEADVQPGRPSVADVTTSNMDTGDIASLLYAAQVRAAGVEISTMGAGFSYAIQGGSLAVIVRSDDDVHKGDPSGFTISVGVAGG
jgi:hypothetical protein